MNKDHVLEAAVKVMEKELRGNNPAMGDCLDRAKELHEQAMDIAEAGFAAAQQGEPDHGFFQIAAGNEILAVKMLLAAGNLAANKHFIEVMLEGIEALEALARGDKNVLGWVPDRRSFLRLFVGRGKLSLNRG